MFSQTLRNPLPFIQDYSMHPASVFFDKGPGFQIGLTQQAAIGGENAAGKPFEAFFNFKQVSTGSLKKAKTRVKKVFPGFSFSIARFNNGGIFEGFSGQAMFGVRYRLGKKTNDFFSVCSAFSMSSEVARIYSRTGFFVVDGNDPVFLSANNLPNYYALGRFSGMLNKRIGKWTYFQVLSTFDANINEYGLGMKRNFNGQIKFLWPKNAREPSSNVFNEWQPASYSSLGAGFNYLSDYGVFLTPQFDFTLGLIDERLKMGQINWRCFRIGLLISLKLESAKTWDGMQVSLKYDFSNHDRRTKMRSEKNEAALSYYQPFGPLHLASNTTGLYFSRNSERLVQDCLIQMREINNVCNGASDVSSCNNCLDIINDSRERYPCFSESEYAEKVKAYEGQMKLIIETKKANELETININNLEWAATNLQLGIGSFAANNEEWIALCNMGKPGFCYVNFDPSLKGLGFIYNKFVVQDFRLLSSIRGYHISTLEDWQSMLNSIDGQSITSWNISQSKWYVLCLISPDYNHPVSCEDYRYNGFNYRNSSYYAESSKGFLSGNASGAFWVPDKNGRIRNVKFHSSHFSCGNFDMDKILADGYFIRLVKDN
jgi:uncharacterized protein (TIGR02145 family)